MGKTKYSKHFIKKSLSQKKRQRLFLASTQKKRNDIVCSQLVIDKYNVDRLELLSEESNSASTSNDLDYSIAAEQFITQENEIEVDADSEITENTLNTTSINDQQSFIVALRHAFLFHKITHVQGDAILKF